MEPQRIAMRTDRNTAILAAALLSVAFGCLFSGGVLLYLWTLPNESFVRLAGLAGVARAQHSIFLAPLVPRLLPGGVLFICLGSSLFIFRRALVRLISDGAQSLGSYVSHTGKNTMRVLRTESRGHILALSIIVSGGILLRLRYLFEPPRIDEATTYLLYAGRSPFYLFYTRLQTTMSFTAP